MITKLEASAFKGLRWFSIEPSKVNLIIGANGTGKTNFADLIEFIAVATRLGLKDAFDQFDGLDEVRTKMAGRGKRLVFSVSLKLGPDPFRGIKSASYSFSLAPEKAIVIERETLDAEVYTRMRGRPSPPAKVNFDQNESTRISFFRERRQLSEWTQSLGMSPNEFPDDDELVLNSYGKIGHFRTVADYLSALRVYNIDSMLAKTSSNGSDTELDRHGRNLISFLKKTLENEMMRKQLLGDLRQAVPYVEAIEPERIYGHTTLKFTESDSGLELRAKQMSDGTIRLLGLLGVLRQPIPPPVLVVEEPENALHSYAVKSFISIVHEMSCDERFPVQTFLTSHSPAVLDAVLSIDSTAEYPTKGFVTKRVDGSSTIEPAPASTMKAIAENLGRPSDFLREGSFQDRPQLELPL